MSAAQWAPWVSVFLGGCLSGAALLSLTSERAADAQRVVTLTPPPGPPSQPVDPNQDSEVAEEATAEPDASDSHASASRVGDEDPALLGESEHAPSAADILSALEQAYQRQVAAEAAAEPAERAPEAASATVETEVAATPLPAAPPAAVDERVAALEPEPAEPVDAPAPAEYAAPVQVATAARADQNHASVQQIAVVYQPVVVLPPSDAAVPTNTAPRRRSVGRDPWAPLAVSPRHNPWGSAGSAGAWATVGVAGGVWAGGFTPRP